MCYPSHGLPVVRLRDRSILLNSDIGNGSVTDVDAEDDHPR